MSEKEGEWKTVTKNDKRRIAKGRRLPIRKSLRDYDPEDDRVEKHQATRWIRICIRDFKRTDLYKESLVPLLKTIHPTEMVCYGIGTFTRRQRLPPVRQLACAICLKEFFKLQRVYYFDPCTSQAEKEILQEEFGFVVLTDNERGFHPVVCCTLFFMPHCPQLLYNNVLASNWENLENILLLGNSLLSYGDKVQSTLAKGIRLLLPYLQEQTLRYSKRDLAAVQNLECAFNDCSLVTVDFGNYKEDFYSSHKSPPEEEMNELLSEVI